MKIRNHLTFYDTVRLTIQSIEGPGGIGKSTLLRHVKGTIPLKGRKYLTLTITGDNIDIVGPERVVERMLHDMTFNGEAPPSPQAFFPETAEVIAQIKWIKDQAAAEMRKRATGDEQAAAGLQQKIDRYIAYGKALSDIIPASTKAVDFSNLEDHRPTIEEAAAAIQALQIEVPSFIEKLGLNGSLNLRNAIRENACKPLADAVVRDLSDILVGYDPAEWYLPKRPRSGTVDRLLIVVDDYEFLQDSLSEFFVGTLLPKLASAQFETVAIIMGRDQLLNTHPGWDQHLSGEMLRPIHLKPLNREELDQLVEGYGFTSTEEKERAWKDTEGYPFTVQLWMQEVEGDGRSAPLLKRFYDRTTRWMNSEQKEWLPSVLFLDSVTEVTLAGMLLDKAEAKRAFEWFQNEGSIRDVSSPTFRVREYLRSRLVDYLRLKDPAWIAELEQNAKRVMAKADERNFAASAQK